MTPPLIRSRQNPRIQSAAKLREKRQRDKQGRFLIDGVREIRRALQAALPLDEVFVCHPLPSGEGVRETLALLQTAQVPLHRVTPDVFAKLAFGDRGDGMVAVGIIPPQRSLADLRLTSQPLLAVLEGVEKPGNLGAIARSADAAGLAALLLADCRTDVYNPNAIRASTGTLFTVPTLTTSTAEVKAWLAKQGIRAFAADPAASKLYTDCDFRGSVAILLGSEARGLSQAWGGVDVTPIRLPMRGTADSLNVSTTAAVLFYEAMRQRDSSLQRS